MKKALLIFIAIILLTKLANAQTNWIDYKIDNRVSVKMPEQPQFKNGGLSAKDKDSSVYIVVVVDFVKTAGVDSTQLAPYEPTPDFANGLKNGMLGKMPGATMGDVKIAKWNGHYCYTVEGGYADRKLKVYAYMVCWGSTMYGLMSIIPEQNSTTSKDDFFASLKAN